MSYTDKISTNKIKFLDFVEITVFDTHFLVDYTYQHIVYTPF